MAISSYITEYTGNVPNRESDTPTEFAQNVYDYQVWIDEYLVGDTAQIIKEINDEATEVNKQSVIATTQASLSTSKASIATTQANTATTKANEASISAASALASKEIVESLVIPTEATYNSTSLDSQQNERDLELFLNFNF